MWEDTRPLIHDLVAPGVEVHCLYGTGVDTAERLIYSKTMPTGNYIMEETPLPYCYNLTNLRYAEFCIYVSLC